MAAPCGARLRDWVRRPNVAEPDGLPRRVDERPATAHEPEQLDALAKIVTADADRAVHCSIASKSLRTDKVATRNDEGANIKQGLDAPPR